MAKKAHSKQHRIDLNQIAHYIAANDDYIPFYGESYPGNLHDSGTFPWIVGNIPRDSTVIFMAFTTLRRMFHFLVRRNTSLLSCFRTTVISCHFTWKGIRTLKHCQRPFNFSQKHPNKKSPNTLIEISPFHAHDEEITCCAMRGGV